MYYSPIRLKVVFKILIIEDDSFKLNSLKSFLSGCLESIRIYESTNLYDAMKIVNDMVFDLILIDMSIPSHPLESGGGTPKSLPVGGMQVIFELKALDRMDNCIIITQYPDIEICGNYYSVSDAENYIYKFFEYSVLKCIQYSEESNLWKIELKKVITSNENFNSRG